MRRGLSLLVMAVVLSGLLFGCAVTGDNSFAHNKVSSSAQAYLYAKSYCKKNISAPEEMDACLDKEYDCMYDISVLAGGHGASPSEIAEADKKTKRMLEEAGKWKAYTRRDLSFCDIFHTLDDGTW